MIQRHGSKGTVQLGKLKALPVCILILYLLSLAYTYSHIHVMDPHMIHLYLVLFIHIASLSLSLHEHLSVLWPCPSMLVISCQSAILFVLSCPVLLCVGLSTYQWWLSELGVSASRIGSFEYLRPTWSSLQATPFEVFSPSLNLTVISKCSTVIGWELEGVQALCVSYCHVIWSDGKLRAGPSDDEWLCQTKVI